MPRSYRHISDYEIEIIVKFNNCKWQVKIHKKWQINFHNSKVNVIIPWG